MRVACLGLKLHLSPGELDASLREFRRKYALDILEETGLFNAKPLGTPMDPSIKLLPNQGEPLLNPGRYRRLVGKLNYVMISCPNIAFAVSVISTVSELTRLSITCCSIGTDPTDATVVEFCIDFACCTLARVSPNLTELTLKMKTRLTQHFPILFQTLSCSVVVLKPPGCCALGGRFFVAKDAASMQNKWLLVNIQSTKEFSSHMLNRDTWANEAVSQTISTNCIFWQGTECEGFSLTRIGRGIKESVCSVVYAAVYDDTTEGRKVCTYYRLDSIPVVLVIDPITGQKMRSWIGMVQPESLLEGLLAFLDAGPKDHHITMSHKRPRGSSSPPKSKALVESDENKEEYEEVQRALAASMESMKESTAMAGRDNKDADVAVNGQETPMAKRPTYPTLPEEPKVERNLLCRVGVRLPDGRRVQRNFLRTDPIQLLWSFISAQLGEDETNSFRLTHAIPGASKILDYEINSTFQESGLANSMISVTWD
ncbi:Plant UBX domain-containing protein 7 [Glycine soja]|uniref:Plant UBX domain-containing protein 7 n=1 Tax=Glycine soja TaxID=3848 RepID=A0A445GGR5_GLYSO|nr:Plant UBX domain-containing protein 7 [Glycine soja]